MKKFNSYKEAEEWTINKIINDPCHINSDTHEILQLGYILTNPRNNRNNRSDYEYAEEFFQWIMSGKKELSKRLLELNPWVERFVRTEGLPKDFSASYAWKISEQLPNIINELRSKKESRRAYINILYPQDQVILHTKTTHEFPCTVGIHFLVRDNLLDVIVNMRSNNALSVMPYDVYNFTRLQESIANAYNFGLGYYYHQMNSAHLYNGDVRRIKEGKLNF